MPRPGEVVVTMWKMLPALGCVLLAGCMTLAETPGTVSSCSFDQVWDAAILTIADVQFETINKAAGVLETQWVEVEASTRAGALQREVNKERLKYVVEVKRDGNGAVATVLQLREEWSPMGVRSRQWRGMPGNPREESAVAVGISKRLKEKGC
jgi:hypothetical protein